MVRLGGPSFFQLCAFCECGREIDQHSPRCAEQSSPPGQPLWHASVRSAHAPSCVAKRAENRSIVTASPHLVDCTQGHSRRCILEPMHTSVVYHFTCAPTRLAPRVE